MATINHLISDRTAQKGLCSFCPTRVTLCLRAGLLHGKFHCHHYNSENYMILGI